MSQATDTTPDEIGTAIQAGAEKQHVRSTIASMLRRAGLSDSTFEARILIEDLGGERPVLDEVSARKLQDALSRRLHGEPLWRILREREFWGLPFTLSPGTLEPRPDSESVIEAAIAQFGTRRQETLRLLDLGTGTGCLLIASLSEFPQATGIGIDLAEDALATAAANAARNRLAERASFRQADWTQGLEGEFDLILSNPPYIPSGEIATLDAAVREHDPLLALDGGTDGLTAYRALAQALPPHLAQGGRIIFEIGAGQKEAVVALMAARGLRHVDTRRDLGGHERALVFAHHD